MEKLFLFTFFFSILLFSHSIVQEWNLEGSAIDLLEGKDFISVPANEDKGYDMYIKLYKRIEKKSDGSIGYKKYFDLYDTRTEPYITIFKGEVDFNKVDSFYFLNNNYIICPKGKYHPLLFYSGSSYNRLDVGNNWSEKGDWELKCYHHYTGYFLVFYLMNEGVQFFYTKTEGSFSWTSQKYHDEIYDFKLNNGNDQGEYALAYIVNSGGYLKLIGSKFTFRDKIDRNDCGGNKYIMNASTKTRGCFDNQFDHFYFLTYSNTSDFSCGYFEAEDSIDYLHVENYNIETNTESPLEFIDEVEIQEIKFINNYKYAYYIINNLNNGKTYHGIIDTKKGLVVFNTEETILTYEPYSSISMLAITADHAYEICVIKDGSCKDSWGCTNTNYNYILDLQGNKCLESCENGKILLVRENFCNDTCDESIYVLNNNKCDLCKNFYPERPYKLINTSQCLSDIPDGAEIYNNKLNLLKCKSGYILKDENCVPNCYETCETCSEYSEENDNHKCLTCKENYILDNTNCISPQTTIIKKVPTTFPIITTTLMTTIPKIIPTTIQTKILTTILTKIPTTIISTTTPIQLPTTIISTTTPIKFPTTIISTTTPIKFPTAIISTTTPIQLPTTIISTTIPIKISTTIPKITHTTILTTITKEISKTTQTKIYNTFPTTIITKTPTTTVPNIQTTLINLLPKTVSIFFNCPNEKCLTCSNESNELGLCLTCNEAKGYKKVNYTLVFTEFYDCILNTSSKLSKYFFNEETQVYRPCYKTCKKCSKGGNELYNNCLECESGYMFRPWENPYNNCVVYSDYYYISPYNQYKPLNSLQCPEESKYIVKNNNKSYCIYDCKEDKIYKYLYNGNCMKECPENTIKENYICKEIGDKCNLGKNELDINSNINQETTEVLIKTYISEFNYTINHVSLYENKNYTIIIYSNSDCIEELSLSMPKVDFKECYNKVKSEYNIKEDLIISIIEKKEKNNAQTFYSFFHPIFGFKLNAEEICKNETIIVKENLTSILSESSENYELQTFITKQGINIFDLKNPFYTDLCYDFDNPSNRDIPLSERIVTIYPNVNLCDEGCQIDGINLDTMTADCNCKFNDIANSNIIKDNALLENAVGELFDLINSSNIMVMKCYKYIFKHFTNSIGGLISTIALFAQLICTLYYFLFGAKYYKMYIYILLDKYLNYLGKSEINDIEIKNIPPKKSIKNQSLKDKLTKNKKEVHFNVSIKSKEKKRNKYKDFVNYSEIDNNKRKMKINKPQMTNYEIKNNLEEIIIHKEKTSLKKIKKEKSLITEKSLKSNKSLNSNDINYLNLISSTKIKVESPLENELNLNNNILENFFEEYLSTSLNDMEYDDAIVKDKRTFCEYFIECLKKKQIFSFTFIASDPIKIRTIKIMLFILNLILYFVVIGLFFSEEYIKELYYIKGKENFFSYIPRSIDKFIYTTIVSIIISYIIDCFFIEEKKIKGIFKREKDNLNNLKSEIIDIIKKIQKGYLTFIIIIFVILFISFYYLLCFNYVYPKTQIEWLKVSLTIFVIMQILSVLKCLLETCLRIWSLHFKSEKFYKLSKLLE